MITVYISIGNSDDKLTQAKWAEFVHAVRPLLEGYTSNIHGEWHSVPDSPFQNACWCAELPQDLTPVVREGLAFRARAYHQDSIAWAEVSLTEFLPPSGPHLGAGS